MYRNHYLSSLKNEIFEICVADSKPVTWEGNILRFFLLILHVSLGVEHRYGIWKGREQPHWVLKTCLWSHCVLLTELSFNLVCHALSTVQAILYVCRLCRNTVMYIASVLEIWSRDFLCLISSNHPVIFFIDSFNYQIGIDSPPHFRH